MNRKTAREKIVVIPQSAIPALVHDETCNAMIHAAAQRGREVMANGIYIHNLSAYMHWVPLVCP